ncbi:MAG: hypothetical protein ACYCRH_11925 [Acidiferrobacteraceae bacterium]
MFLEIAQEAKEDLDKLWDEDAQAAARIELILQEAQNNPTLLAELSRDVFDNGVINTERWMDQWKMGRNLFRLKIWFLERHRGQRYRIRYRIIYAFQPLKNSYHILGVVTRDFEYEDQDPRTERIKTAYSRLGLPFYGSRQ